MAEHRPAVSHPTRAVCRGSARVSNQNKWVILYSQTKQRSIYTLSLKKSMMELLTRVLCQRNNSSVDDARAKNLLLVLKGIFLLHEGPFRDHPDQ